MAVTHELGQQIVDAYRDIDEFTRSKGGPDIIDIDVAPPQQESFKIWNYTQARKRLSHLAGQVEVTEDDPESRLVGARLNSTLAYLGYISRSGEKRSFDNTIRRTLGFKPFHFSETSINISHVVLDSMLVDYGRRHGKELGYKPKYFGAYHEHFDIPEIKLTSRARRAAKRVSKVLHDNLIMPEGVELPDFERDVDINAEPVDAPWVGHVTTTGPDKKISYTLNSHPRHLHTPASQDLISVHEMTHVAEFRLKQREIAEGRMNPIHGITTYHGPEILQAEFNAQAAEHVLAEATHRWTHSFQHRLSDHFTMVWNNAHIDLNHGRPVREVKAFLRRELPLHQRENLYAQIKPRVEDPNTQIYYMSYPAGIRLILGYFQRLPRGRQVRELGAALLASRTYGQMSEHYESLV